MTSPLGSSEHARHVATGRLLNAGWPRLAASVGGHVASFGDLCWQTDARLSEVLRRPDGRAYHRESIARARRQLRDAQIISSERVFVGGKIPQAKYRSSRGTTLKTFNWRAIAEKNPFSRRERRLHRQDQAREAREAGELVKGPRTAPRHVSSRSIVDPVQMPVALDPEFVRLAAAAQTPQRRHTAATNTRAEQVSERVSAPERPPPD